MMELEINSQGQIIENLIKKYIVNYCVLMDIPLEIRRVVIFASGSSYNASLFGKYFFENIAKIETNVEYASEAAYRDFSNYDKNSLYIFVSQSGNSEDTFLIMQKIKEIKAGTLCITNNKKSKIYGLADFKFDIEAGLENAIAATKTFSASLTMLWLIALKAAQNKRLDITDEIKNIYQLRTNIDFALNNIDNIDYAAQFISKQKEFSICGFDTNYPLAREAALKIKETSYINTSSYPLGEFIHGHFALLNKSKVFLAFIPEYAGEFELKTLKKILSTYKTKAIIISDVWEDYDCDILIKFPKCSSKIASIISMVIVLQLLALKIALKLKRNVDKPKGLDKVVSNEGL